MRSYLKKNMFNVNVENFEGKNGKVKNQFIIRIAGTEYFQSYNSIIAIKFYDSEKAKYRIAINKDKWNYSVTTGKYRNQFLNETKKETEKKIK